MRKVAPRTGEETGQRGLLGEGALQSDRGQRAPAPGQAYQTSLSKLEGEFDYALACFGVYQDCNGRTLLSGRFVFYCAISALIFIAVDRRRGVAILGKDCLLLRGLRRWILAETTIDLFFRRGGPEKILGAEARSRISYSQLPKFAVDALISAEDQRFWSHWGVSLPDIFRAVVRNILREGSLKGHGASTITQQLARNLFLTRDQTWGRKLPGAADRRAA